MKPQHNTREKIKILLESGEHNIQKIIKATGASPATIYRVRSRLKNNQEMKHGQVAGRPKKLSPAHRRRLAAITNHHPTWNAAKLAKRLSDIGGPKASHDTITRNLRSMGWKKTKPALKPILTPAQKAKRVAWCLKNIHKRWKKVVFTDESYFQYFRNKTPVWSKGRKLVPTPKYSPKVMVWGGLSYRGLTPLKLDCGSVNSEVYIKILQNFLVPTMSTLYPDKFTLVQDNATPHTSKLTKAFLKTQNFRVSDWPPNSPDLNPIENLWAIIKHRVEVLVPKSMDDFRTKIEQVWDTLETEVIMNLINSMPERIRRCIEAKGECIKN